MTVTELQDGITEQDIYWAAGYLDARGGFYFFANQIRMVLTDQDREVLSRFAWITGAGNIRTAPSGKAGTRTTNKLDFGARPQLRKFIETFRPLITRQELRDQMDRAQAWLDSRERK